MREIFVSYRRKDSSDVTGRIFDRLKARFGLKSLFKDVDSIPLGFNFRVVIEDAVGQCKVLLAIIGEDWLDLKDDTGRRRIENTDDYVHIEIGSALRRGIPVIPVLVENQLMPQPDELPGPLRELAFRNAIQVRADPDFQHDIERLCAQLAEFASPLSGRAKFMRWCLGVSLTSILLILAFLGPRFLKESIPQPPPAQIEQARRHIALGDAFCTVEEWSSAVSEYRQALVLWPNNQEIKEKMELVKSRTKEKSQ